MARLICGILMHINLVARVTQGMEMMKFSLNHHWKFTNWFFGFMAGFLQANVVLLIEMVNFVSIVTHFEIIDIVMKFMTLMVIMTFSNIFFIAYDEDDYKKIITHKKYQNFLIRQTTTSYYAKDERNKVQLQSCEYFKHNNSDPRNRTVEVP